ncbi:MAG TPA: hypothetical protein VHE58_02805 [Burkholderiales bacterium]|nr:hypothetical protein [Burkholderiales bacterium]
MNIGRWIHARILFAGGWTPKARSPMISGPINSALLFFVHGGEAWLFMRLCQRVEIPMTNSLSG